MPFLGQWEREEGGGGVGVATVQGFHCSTLRPQQYGGRQEAYILLQGPWWVHITLHRLVDTVQSQHWSLLSLLQVFIMCLTQPLPGLSACLKARENLWSGFRGKSRTTAVCQWWLQLVQVFQQKLFLEFKVLFLINASCLPSTNLTYFIFV